MLLKNKIKNISVFVKKYFNFNLIFMTCAVLISCKAYESSGRKSFQEKSQGKIVTNIGDLSVDANIENCAELSPEDWQNYQVDFQNQMATKENSQSLLVLKIKNKIQVCHITDSQIQEKGNINDID